jgi:pimeloyl-ACP methyl ester carboxylesterase
MLHLIYFVGVVTSFFDPVLAAPSPVNSLNFQFPTQGPNSEPKPFQISVDTGFIKRTVQKAGLYRSSIALIEQNSTWEDGPPPQEINELARYWTQEYDWLAVQKQLNSNFSHYTTNILGSRNYQHPIPLHFVHERSSQSPEDAIPLLLLHGWPSSHHEWAKVIHPLANPSNKSSPRFNVVAPDLPGFGFSPAPTHPGLGPREMGLAFDALMHQLGYAKYAVASTDLGWLVASWMTYDTTSVIAHSTDFFLVIPNATDVARFAANETSADETAYIKSLGQFQTDDFGYSVIQGTKPLQLALALTDSPVGFVGWIWQLMASISDGYMYSKEELITTAMLLWIQGTYGNLRAYKEFDTVRCIDLIFFTRYGVKYMLIGCVEDFLDSAYISTDGCSTVGELERCSSWSWSSSIYGRLTYLQSL